MSIRYLLATVSYILLFLIMLAMNSCTTGVNGPQSDAEQISTATDSAVPLSATPESTGTPESTATLRPASTDGLATPDHTPLANLPLVSLTPLSAATLTPGQKSEVLAELMRTNGGCELPCWWGIVPGKSDLETTREDLAAKGFRVGSNSAGMRGSNDFGAFMEFEVENGTIQAVRVGGEYLTGTEDSLAYSRAFAQGWQQYEPQAVLSRYGLPSQVFVYSPFRADPGGGPSYHLLLFYDDLGFDIEYRGDAEQLDGDRYRACPDLANIWDISLFLYQPGQVDSVVERLLPPDSIDYIAGPETVYELISWEQATGTTLDYFYESFSEAGKEACFEFVTP